MEKMGGKTLDIVTDNIVKLREIFPEVFNEDKVDFEKLETILGEYKDNSAERYNFSWPGKSKAIRIAQTPSTGTLRPWKEESKNWDETENIYIEGDNLEVLKLLQKSYYGKVKMIYIDPPYNTGNDFVYKDDFKDNLENYLAITSQKDEEGNKITTNTEANGRYHSNWLNMMYPRLKLARNLLKDDGVILISIDSNEIENLQKICNEIFGEENLITNFIWVNNERGRSIDKFISNTNEYILMYAKNINSVTINQRKETGEDILKEFSLKDEKSYYKKGDPLFNNNSKFNIETRPNLVYTIYVNKETNEKICIDEKYKLEDGSWALPTESKMGEEWIRIVPPLRNTNNKIGCWRWGMQKFIDENESELMLVKENSGKYMFYSKNRLDGDNAKWYKYKNIISGITSSSGTTELVKILEGKFFEHPKPIKLLETLIELASDENSIILDFFSGSSSTAHATMKINQLYGSKRKFIMVQLPEKIEENSEAYEFGYKNICDIGKDRIRRAGEKIKEENKDKEGIEGLDIGFKVFKLDSSNINKWEANYEQNLESTLLSSIENIKKGRTEEDILYEILLKYGIDLNMPIEEHLINGKKVFDIGFGALIACLDNSITLDVVEGIGKLKEELEPDTCRVVFMDNGFSSDSLKTNTLQILKRYNIEDVKCV
nr:site-specific DNA-methyltransferase [Clostridium beijerinckii]